MSDHRNVPEPGEMVYAPKPSWAPLFFALGATGLIAGTFAAGFIFPPLVYAVVGAIFILGAFRSLVRGSIGGYYGLPRRQRVRNAALPIETIAAPPRP
jgi:hypothetical protein